MRLQCGAICLIALLVSLSREESNQETGASKQLAPGVPYAHLLTATVFNGALRHMKKLK